MAVTSWSAEALAELRSLERSSPAGVAREIRQRAQRRAAAAGRERVQRPDLGAALTEYYAEQRGEDGDASEASERG